MEKPYTHDLSLQSIKVNINKDTSRGKREPWTRCDEDGTSAVFLAKPHNARRGHENVREAKWRDIVQDTCSVLHRTIAVVKHKASGKLSLSRGI